MYGGESSKLGVSHCPLYQAPSYDACLGRMSNKTELTATIDFDRRHQAACEEVHTPPRDLRIQKFEFVSCTARANAPMVVSVDLPALIGAGLTNYRFKIFI
ncbi:hypothetical protein RRG08_047290 [Elysia crispata]|uniref:Uncharacterized protein n=1 Tax=Elysia crispata TaxID=231223 RepID=A0AAE0ZE74_9GAST|nr:hypothetical protein RRG08_047290 [Elysia crispata]